MLAKAAEKRQNRRTHTRNFTAGEVAASTHYLERTGIRGKKRWVLLLAVAILAIVILGNFVVGSFSILPCVPVHDRRLIFYSSHA